MSLQSNVGKLTVNAFNQQKLEFFGNEHGIHAIRRTVTGELAMEVISDREMRAYGWCFMVNGLQPDNFPDEVTLTNENDVVVWFFGFAHYLNGEWISYCTPTNTIRPDYICKDHR